MIIVVEIVFGGNMIGAPGVLGISKKTPKWQNSAPQVSAWATAIDQAKRYNVVELATQQSELRRASGKEFQGPCPKCGGTDRLHVRADGWFCRNCKPFDAGHGWNDAIDWIQHMDGKTFDDAVTELTGVVRDSSRQTERPAVTTQKPKAQPSPAPVAPQTDEWRAQALPIVEAAQAALVAGDNAGLSYLAERGLTMATCQSFGFGFGSFREHPAIVIPWTRGGKLQAIRYRFLSPVDGKKILSEPGSRFAESMYGGQVLCGCMEHKRTLVICEGEINAASIWQAASESYLDVLSTGSESAILPKPALDYAAKFRTCIVWMDKPDVAKKWADMIPGAIAVASPNGMDANDMLKSGKLAYFLAHVRSKAATSADKQAALKWDLWDHHNLYGGLDAKTVQVMAAL